MFHADGEIATARAAKRAGIPMVLSQLTTSTFEEVTQTHPDGAKGLQVPSAPPRPLPSSSITAAPVAPLAALRLA